MSSFPSTFRSEYTATDTSSYGSLAASFKEPRNTADSDTESRVQDAQGGRYLDLDLDYVLDDGGTKKNASSVSSNSSNTLIVGSAELSDSKLSKDGTGTGDRSTYQMESPDQQDDIEFFKSGRKPSCGERLIQFIMLTLSFIFDFLLVYLDHLLDFALGAIYFWYEEITLGILTWLFPIVAGIICAVQLPKLLEKHKNAYYDLKSNFCKVLSKIPTLQPAIFSFYVFKTEVRYYPLNLRYTPHVADLQQISKRLNILQAAFESTPQALLQMFVYLIGYKWLENAELAQYMIGLKITLSLISMSRLCVGYWQAYTPFIFISDIRDREFLITQNGGCCSQFWKQLANFCIQLPYYWEGLMLSGLRVITLILAAPMLKNLLASPIKLDLFQPPVYLIPIILLGLLLTLPRLIHSTLLWLRCKFSCNLKQQWKQYGISPREQDDQETEYFTELLKRSLYSIIVYPIYPCSIFLIFYVNLEIIVVFAYYFFNDNANSELPNVNQPVLIALLVTYYCSFIVRLLYEKLILSKPKSRYLLPQRIVQKCENIIQKLESENPPSFTQMKKNILDFTEFYFQRVIGKKFVTTRGIQKYLDDKEQILEMFTLPWNSKSKSALIKEYPIKIAESGNRLVLKKLPLWNYVNYFCCQVLVYYSMKHRHVFEKFELFQNLRRLHKFKTVQFNNMSEEEREVLLSFVEILQPLSYICLINFHTSPTFNYTAIQNFTHFEVPLGSTAMRDIDTEKLAYVLESVVAAKKKDWNLTSLNNLHLESEPRDDEIEFEPLIYENIPFMDAML